MSVQNLWVAQKCAFIVKSAIFTFFCPFFKKFIRKTWANRFRGVRVLWAHSGAKKLEKLSKIHVFPILSPRSEPKVLLRPGIGLPTFFWWIWKKNGPKKCKNCGFSNKSTFLGHPQILNRHIRSLETLFMKCNKILFEKCKIGVILRYHASQILIKLIQEHWFFLARTWAFFGGWRILEVGISVTGAPGDPKIFFWDIPP